MDLPSFEPHPWLTNPHCMTLAAAFWPRRTHHVGLRSQARRIVVAEGIEILTWVDQPEAKLGRVRGTLLLCHGLTGSADSRYLLGMADKALAHGLRTVRMNFRGAGGSEALSPALYHSGLSSDVDAVVRELERDAPDSPLFVVGFSLGGNVVLKLAAEWGAAPPRSVRRVAAISPPIDLAACSAALDSSWLNRRYRENFLRGLCDHVRRVARVWPGRIDTARLSGITTVREFDERITAPHFGFENATDYYARASAAPLLPAIVVDTLIVTAADDPLVPPGPWRTPQVNINSSLAIVVLQRGGHLGFLSRRAESGVFDRPRDRFWAEWRVIDFILGVLPPLRIG